MIELFHKGGPLMYPILFCSILALAIFFERFWTYSSIARRSARLSGEVETLVKQQHLVEARAVCQRSPFLLSHIFSVALSAAGHSRERIKVLVEEVGSRQLTTLERYLGLLATIAAISPLLGLLGTVLGMIRAFTDLSIQGVGTPETLGAGISEALITTATGLSVAIPVILLHKYLTSRADRIANDMEDYALRLVDHLASDSCHCD
ncbi:MAG: MotA/TolQ/ExbB proton channel family protein [Desulfuromonadaceae bacterium]|nr:MotA/TolQ/ExbB proton channel family protein [Desulfuromonadaceae bacterium]